MKKVLYLSNIEVPYRVRFFNEFSKHCDLTVVYEREKSSSRNAEWTKSESGNYKTEYLGGIKIKGEDAFSLKVLKYVFGKYDEIIVGCYNSHVYMFAILLMKIFRIPYILNVDGEVFVGDKGFKNIAKKFFLSGASKYLAAGEKSAESLKAIAKGKEIVPYYFSSLSREELQRNSQEKRERGNTVLVVGQYLHCKGLDVALDVARKTPDVNYKFIGMGSKTNVFMEEYKAEGLPNVEFVPFLKKSELEEEYRTCGVFVLPSRQECWGLVINEAASFGTPIVSTYGSGAATEFLADSYPQFLAKPGDSESLLLAINNLRNSNTYEYSRFLLEKSKKYSIEASLEAHIHICELN